MDMLNIKKFRQSKIFIYELQELQKLIAPYITNYVCFEWIVVDNYGVDYGPTYLGLDNLNQDFDLSKSAWFSEEVDGDFQKKSSLDACETRNKIKLNVHQKNMIEQFYSMVPNYRELSEIDNFISHASKLLIEKNRILFFDGSLSHEF